MPTARIQGSLRSAVSKTTNTINQTQTSPIAKISRRCTKRLSNLMILRGLCRSQFGADLVQQLLQSCVDGYHRCAGACLTVAGCPNGESIPAAVSSLRRVYKGRYVELLQRAVGRIL